jgi:predicted site-specific integrase-resolvase
VRLHRTTLRDKLSAYPERLCVSKRTLQDYRDTGLLGYVQLPGKIIYRESEIERLLEDYYINKRLLK